MAYITGDEFTLLSQIYIDIGARLLFVAIVTNM